MHLRYPRARWLSVLFLVPTLVHAQPDAGTWVTPFEKDSAWSATWEEAYDWYGRLNDRFPDWLQWEPFGESDGFFPWNVAVITNPLTAREGKVVILINNAIHPGESEGVDASRMLARSLLTDPNWQDRLDSLVVVIIPYYNLDGGADRRPVTRANQNGPRMQGFRGNARNLDLNRDFIKCDSRNALSFTQLFRTWDPDLFIDTHTSNGADYQATVTVIPTQPEGLPAALSRYQQGFVLPKVYSWMEDHGWPMTPYVHSDGPPESGIWGFLDLPRFSTGYAALYQTLGFTLETHMLKPFPDRVRSTLTFLQGILALGADHAAEIKAIRRQAREEARQQSDWTLAWMPDSSRVDSLRFGGYEPGMKPSLHSGTDRLFYDRSRPYLKRIPYRAHFLPVLRVSRPVGWIVPQAWTEVLERLDANRIEMYRLASDTVIITAVHQILDEKTPERAYEGHYLHHGVVVADTLVQVAVRTGDVWIPSDQEGIAYLMATMDPRAPDSWFAWNFFDGILQRKEYFSDYVFEDLATEILRSDPGLNRRFIQAREEHPEWAEDGWAPLYWIYRNSDLAEPGYRRFPIVPVYAGPAFRLKPFSGIRP